MWLLSLYLHFLRQTNRLYIQGISAALETFRSWLALRQWILDKFQEYRYKAAITVVRKYD